ncbi:MULTISPECIES: hypothetical protein [Persicobacter]|nr:hypothetical protein [Persicobacter sp. CCB-QB2]
MKQISLNSIWLWVVLILFISACSTPQPPEFKGIHDIVFSPTSNNMVKVQAQARLFNPNKNKLVLNSVDLQMHLDQEPVAELVKDYDLPIPPEGEFDIPIELEVPMKMVQDKIFKGALLNFMGGKPIQAQFTGDIKVKASGIPVKVPVNIKKEIDLMNL